MPKVTSKTSFCWRYFTKINTTSVKCKICAKELKTSGNTTNMKDHLRAVHKVSKDDAEIDCNETKRMASQMSIINCLEKASEFGSDGQKTRQINDAIVFMIGKGMQPFSIVDNEGFIHLMKTVAPRYKIPSRATITKWVDDKHAELKESSKTLLQDKTVTITMDVWSDQMSMRSYLGITVHFQLQNEMMSLTIGVLELTERHTSAYLCDVLESCCTDWNIKKDLVTAVVTDNGANVVKAVDLAFGRKKHIPCFAHTLNLIARAAMQKDEINSMISKVKEIVTFFKKSSVASEKLRKHTEKNLIQDVATRWNSTFYMIDRFLELKNIINDILLNVCNELTMLNGNELQLLNDIIPLLSPIEEATKIVSGDSYCTASTIIPMVNILKEKLANVTPNMANAIVIKEFLLNEIDKRMGAIEQVSILSMATVLDPRFKKLHFKDAQACETSIQKIKSIAKPMATENVKENLINAENNNLSSFWDHHHKLAQSHSPNGDIDIEIMSYLRMPLAPFNSNPLEVWDGMKNSFPNLHTVASQFLPVVGSSVPSERVFSAASNVLTRKRNRITPERLSRILFLKSVNKKYYFSNLND